jgi:hypothetical protein
MNIDRLSTSIIGKSLRKWFWFTDSLRVIAQNPQQKIFDDSVYFLETNNALWKRFGSTQENEMGHYFEFGVQDGESVEKVWRAIRKYHKQIPSHWNIYGFDSFEGLPDFQNSADIHPVVGKGAYKSRGADFVRERLQKKGVPAEKIILVPGFFEKSLTQELKKKLNYPKASLVTIDCDYYSATLTALDWVEELLYDGSLVYFDDVGFYNYNPNKGELKAIADFNAKRKGASGLSPLMQLDTGGHVYIYWRSADYDTKTEKLSFYGDPDALHLNATQATRGPVRKNYKKTRSR